MTGNIKVLLIVLLTVSTLADEVDPDYTYEDFMRQFNRTYTGEEKAIHEKAFYINYADLLARQLRGENAVVNKFLDWTQEELDGITFFYSQLSSTITPNNLISLFLPDPSEQASCSLLPQQRMIGGITAE